MPEPVAMIFRFPIPCLFAIALVVPAARADTASVQTAWRLLDYIAVDYPGAVQKGAVISVGEYAEMVEFAAAARERIAALPASGAKAGLQQRAAAFQILVGDKAPAADVASSARALATDLIKAYPVPLVPAKTPDFALGRKLYAQSCLSCHGVDGDGRGPAAIGLEPPPTAFTDKHRADERSVFALEQVIEQGLPGTSMASFAALPPHERWSLALYVGAFAYPGNAVAEGERLWHDDAALRARIKLEDLAGMTPASFAEKTGKTKAVAVTAYLRRNPEAVRDSSAGPLALARSRLEEARAAYAQGDRKDATDLALSAYLDGFEPVEPILSVHNHALLLRIEGAMGALRTGIAQGMSPDEIRDQAGALDVLLSDAELILDHGDAAAPSLFFGAFTILLREGLEALLIVVTMFAFLRQTGQGDLQRYVHGGWVAALVAGGLTWLVAAYFIGISGASRELTEGFGSVFAAIVLLWVGLWMHGKSGTRAWQSYISKKMNYALNGRSAWFLFGLAFVVVYREVFETILFYAAIWHHGNGRPVLAGGTAAVVALLAAAWVMMRYNRTLPVGKFFAYSSVLIAVLAVVLIGKGVAALQEAGYLPIHSLPGFPRIPALGLFPTREGVIASLAMIICLVLGFVYNRSATVVP